MNLQESAEIIGHRSGTVDDLIGFVLKSDYSDSGPSIVIEDDGRVCYAYYISSEGKILGDVWLYNRCIAPAEPEWKSSVQAPFANSRDYVRENIGFKLPLNGSDVGLEWVRVEDGLEARIFVDQLLIGVVGEGLKPGFALAAAKDGPLARHMRDRNSP